MRWWETEGRRHAGMKRVKSERMGVYALFAIVVLASASGNLSQTAVNAMLGDIMLQFGLTVDLGQWLTTSYMLVLGITVPVATFLSRRFSVRQHVFIALAFFLVGALADLFAPNFGVLLAGRVFQAISTGMLMPLMQTIAMTRFPRGRQATAMGVAGIAMGFAPNIGPTIGGAMSFSLGWRSFFVLLVLGALFLVLFVRRQKRVDDPLISMDIFSSRQYRAGFIAQNLLNASFMGVTLIVPLYVEGLCGGTALEAGVVLLPGTVAALVLNPLAGVLTDKVGVRPVALVSGAFLATGAVLMSFLDADTPLYVTTLCQAVRAVGVSGLVGPLTSWSLAQLPRPIVADGSSFCISARQACASLGTSVMVFLIAVAGASAAGLANPALAYQLAFGFSAVMAVATLGFIVAKVR